MIASTVEGAAVGLGFVAVDGDAGGPLWRPVVVDVATAIDDMATTNSTLNNSLTTGLRANCLGKQLQPRLAILTW
jgi:hypothetical protein